MTSIIMLKFCITPWLPALGEMWDWGCVTVCKKKNQYVFKHICEEFDLNYSVEDVDMIQRIGIPVGTKDGARNHHG